MRILILLTSFWAIISINTPARALINSTINVTTYCTSIGSGNDQNCINSAISAANSAGGGVVYFPCGVFTTNGSIVIPNSNIKLVGAGKCTTIQGSGNFHTVTEYAPSATSLGTSDYYGNEISDITFDESLKTGGYTLDMANVAQLRLTNLYINYPWCGPHIHDFNDVIAENIIIYNTIGGSRGIGCQAFLLTGGGSGDSYGRSDVINFRDFVISGRAKEERTNSHHGIVVDGFVNTINSVKMYLTNVDGHGLWIRNSIGASQSPQFGSLYGLEADYSYGAAIFIQQGSVFHFTDPMVNGSLTLANILLGSGTSRISFEGGFSSNANQAGIDSSATQVAVANMDIVCNSNPGQGGTAGAWAGIVLETATRFATVTGNKSGCPAAPSYQKYGIQVNSGADQYTITANALANNNLGGFSGASGTSSKISANNAQ